MIRQAISCDICASEKRQTNHWFVAYEQAGELRVSGWSSRHKLRPGSKHLCGQTCLHKLVDEFIANAIAARMQRPAEENDCDAPAISDASLTSAAAYTALESSARIISPPSIAPPTPPLTLRPPYRPQPELVPPRPHSPDCITTPEESSRFASRNWHAGAWEREREREQRAMGNRPGVTSRRASNA